MRHRLITPGGEIYLPFAESAIRKLLSLGLPYADQAFVVDGFMIRVRVEPGHEYIKIEGGGSSIVLDSGVVDVGGVGELAPLTYKPGILYKPQYVAAYDALYTIPSGKNKLGDPLFSKKPPGPPGNVTGHISGGTRVVSRTPGDAKTAESFAVMDVATTQPDGTVTYAPVEKDEVLRNKKITAVYCPASMFTGRCRLYVQAIYGSPIYKKRTGGFIKDVPNYRMVYEPGSGAPPYLEIEPYVAAGDENYYVWPAITKNTGVYFDPVSFRHHLVCVNATTIHVYPMKVGSAATQLISLLDPSKSPKMTDADRTHLEAYILSVSTPNASARKTYEVAELSTAPSCGYGWHWNWSGTKADAVENYTFPQYEQDPPETFPLYYGMESTHVRLELTRVATIKPDGTEDKAHPTFSFKQTTVTPATKWAIHSHKWCIAFPAWDGTLLKLTPQRTRMFECDAPFYAFYKGDELKVCEVHVRTAHDEPTREMSENYTANPVPEYGAATSAYTLSLAGGHLRDDYPQSDYWEVNFSCGDYESPKTTFEKWNAVVTSEVSEKTLGAWDESGQEQEPVFTGEIDVGYPSGGDVALGVAGLNVGYGKEFFDALFSAPDGAALSYSMTKGSGTDRFNGLAEIVIPTYDAEAVIFDCIEAKTNVVTTYEKTFAVDVFSTYFVTSFRTNPIDRGTMTLTGNITRNYRYGWDDSEGRWGSTGTSTVNTDVTTESVVTERNAVMICNAGSVDVEMEPGSLYAFHEHSDPDVIPSPYFVRTGIHSATPTPVIAKMLDNPDTISDLSFPVIVGWT